MYDLISKIIVVSRDVVFNKDKIWKWNKFEYDIIEKSGILRVIIGEYGN